MSLLHQRIEEITPEVLLERRRVLSVFGDRVAETVTVLQLFTGQKNARTLVSALPHTGSFVDNDLGLYVAGQPIADVAKQLFEANVWRLYTSEHPSTDQTESLRLRLAQARLTFEQTHQRGGELDQLIALGCSADRDPMDILVMAIAHLSASSRVGKHLRQFSVETITWQDRLDDCLDLLAAVAIIIGRIYCRLYNRDHSGEARIGDTLAESVVRSFGAAQDDSQFQTQVRIVNLLLNVMCYHGIGNVSTNLGVIASSAGSSPYQSYCSLLGGLVGPNHGGAAAFGVEFLFRLAERYGYDTTEDQLQAEAAARLDAKAPIWTVGHRVLRGEGGDPRANVVLAELKQLNSNHPLLRLAERWYGQAIPVVQDRTDIAFPAPNVDSFTGVALVLAGILTRREQAGIAGLFFALSRASGAGAEIYWNATPKAPLMRPSAHTLQSIKAL